MSSQQMGEYLIHDEGIDNDQSETQESHNIQPKLNNFLGSWVWHSVAIYCHAYWSIFCHRLRGSNK